MVKQLAVMVTSILIVASNQLNARPFMVQQVPKEATVVVDLRRAPGINDDESNWELSYEFRIANDTDIWEAWKESKIRGGSDQRLGALIKEDVVKRNLRTVANRRVVIAIPLGREIQERLRNQPRVLVKVHPGRMTPEDIKLLKEQELRSQSFFLYAVINVHDAKLKKTVIIPATFSWPFLNYPQARFQIMVDINNDGSYSVNTTLPTTDYSE